ncbi:M16 family metallopeptidase [Luteolibacter algae]|uniref:M16 family metallopeptidase n=1 Tax=Luteolibacter algae TaxID=454151 RepID=A0ABW5D6U0_9BACT
MPATYSTHDLPGGPRLAHSHLPESECAAVSIYIPVGSRDEIGNIPAGLAHFSEHMAFKGTKTRSAKELTLAIESGGGQANAATSEDHTVYEAQGEAELMPVLIEVLADMVWHSTFPSNEIELERDVIGEEITMIRESPSDHINDLLASALWPSHPLGQSISGSLESIEKISRSSLKHFAKEHHFRKDLVIATAGPMSAEEILASLLPQMPKKFKKPALQQAYSPSPSREIIENRPTDQLQLGLAWHTPGRHSGQRHALRMLSLILGESSSSRLFTELREERGLCYQVGSETTLFHETGALQILAGLDPDSRDESMETIFRETQDLADNGPRPGELERAKRLAIAQSKLAFESTAAHAAWAGEGLLFYNRIPSPQEARENFLNVTGEQVQAIAKTIFAQQPATAEIRS